MHIICVYTYLWAFVYESLFLCTIMYVVCWSYCHRCCMMLGYGDHEPSWSYPCAHICISFYIYTYYFSYFHILASMYLHLLSCVHVTTRSFCLFSLQTKNSKFGRLRPLNLGSHDKAAAQSEISWDSQGYTWSAINDSNMLEPLFFTTIMYMIYTYVWLSGTSGVAVYKTLIE